MITYRWARLAGSPSPDAVAVVGSNGPETVAAPLPLGPLAPDARVLLAHCPVVVGIARRELTIAVGARARGAPDLERPLGLAATPVVVLADASMGDLSEAGARRAGRGPTLEAFSADTPGLGLQMLEAVDDGVEVLLIEGGSGPHLAVARALGGRPIAALPLGEPGAVNRYLAGCDVDITLAIPSTKDSVRTSLETTLRTLALERLHHLVEVDAAPAFAEVGLDPAGASLAARCAAAAGVLAGRLAAGNRRWRDQLAP